MAAIRNCQQDSPDQATPVSHPEMRQGKRVFAGIQVLHKTMDVLDLLRENRGGLGLAEVTGALQVPKPTVYRILATLESRGYLDRGERGRYRIARKLFESPNERSVEQALLQAARPAMQRLLASVKETVNLGVLDGGEVLVIDTLESPLAVRMSSKVGNRRDLHSTALGKAMLAGMDEKEAARLIRMKGLPRLTKATITDEARLRTELSRIRQQGYALDNRENEDDGRCIAAPIGGPDGKVIAALSLSGPVPRVTLARARGLAGPLRLACREISSSLRQ
jgi:DNA-binding IclR family transcriptional regulator